MIGAATRSSRLSRSVPEIEPSDTDSIEEPSSDAQAHVIRESLREVGDIILADPDLRDAVGDADQVIDAFLGRFTMAAVDLGFDDEAGGKVMAAFVETIPEDCWVDLADRFAAIRTMRLPEKISARPDLCRQLFAGLGHFPHLERVYMPQPAGLVVDTRGCKRSLEIEFGEVGHAMQVLAGDKVVVYGSGNFDDCELVIHGADGEAQVAMPLPSHRQLPPPALIGGNQLPPPRSVALLQTLQNELVDAVDARQIAKVRTCVQCILDPDNRFTAQQRARALKLQDIGRGKYSLLNWAHALAFSVHQGRMRVSPHVVQAITNMVASEKGEILGAYRNEILSAQFPAAGGDPLLLRIADPVLDPAVRRAFEGFPRILFNGEFMSAHLGEIISSRSLSMEDKALLCASVPIELLSITPEVAAIMWVVISRAAPTRDERRYLLGQLGVTLDDIVAGLRMRVDARLVDLPLCDAVRCLKGWNEKTRALPASTFAGLDKGLLAFGRQAGRFHTVLEQVPEEHLTMAATLRDRFPRTT